MRRLARVVGVLAATAALSGLAPVAADTAACRSEDSTWCVWWGPVQGNGQGAIVVNLGDSFHRIG